jgi:hypothetical protein
MFIYELWSIHLRPATPRVHMTQCYTLAKQSPLPEQYESAEPVMGLT